ncbi:MAG: hypothetical protein AB7U20_15305 [Planctomycetaceae bacterium]
MTRLVAAREHKRLTAIRFRDNTQCAGQALRFGNDEVVNKQLFLQPNVDDPIGSGLRRNQ